MLLIFFVNNIIIISSNSNKNENKKKTRKVKDLTIEELLGEKPFYSSYFKNQNLEIKELENY